MLAYVPFSRLAHLWSGPAHLARPLQLEWRFATVRWLGIVVMLLGLPLIGLAPERLLLGYAVIRLAAGYNLMATRLLLVQHPLVPRAALTSIGESCLKLFVLMAICG